MPDVSFLVLTLYPHRTLLDRVTHLAASRLYTVISHIRMQIILLLIWISECHTKAVILVPTLNAHSDLSNRANLSHAKLPHTTRIVNKIYT